MRFRAIIYAIDGSVDNLLVSQKGGNMFDFNGRSYRKMVECNRPVATKEGLTDIIEAVYQEGLSNPINSKISETETCKMVFGEAYSVSSWKPHKSFWSWLLRRD